MNSLRTAILAFSIALLFIPMVLIVKKVTSYDNSVNFRVSFDPVSCYDCKDCPCKYTVNNGDSYILSSFDKNQCTSDHDKINEGIEKGLDSITVEMSVKQYRKFFDCVKWYSLHPTTSIETSNNQELL